MLEVPSDPIILEKYKNDYFRSLSNDKSKVKPKSNTSSGGKYQNSISWELIIVGMIKLPQQKETKSIQDCRVFSTERKRRANYAKSSFSSTKIMSFSYSKISKLNYDTILF